MLQPERVAFLLADARELYDDALEMLEQDRLRNAADKAWCATKRATDALILARTGDEPRTSGETMRMLRQLRGKTRPWSRCGYSMAVANPFCTAELSMTASWSRKTT